ncbi:MAG: GNAT family N-acetyltransferase [Terriglobia bacterium]
MRLSPADWDMLAGIADGFRPDPSRSVAVVALNDEGKIIGRVFLMAPVHVEGIFIDPQQRNGLLLGKLVERVEEEAKKEGVQTLFAYAADEVMENIIERLGYSRAPATVWQKRMA